MTAGKSIGVAVVGAGTMGTIHGRAWEQHGESTVVAVCDVDGTRAAALATELGASSSDSYEETLARSDIDAVSVCVPVSLHPEVSIFAMNHGKHVLCEKPIALTIEDADRMIAAAERNRVRLGISYQYRCFDYFAEVRRRYRAGDFGGPLFVRASDIREVRPKLAMHRTSMNGGPVIDMAGHYFDLMRFITGEEPERVSARGHVFGRGKRRLAGIADPAIDAADIQVTMGGGHLLHVFVDWGMPEGFVAVSDFTAVGPELYVGLSGGTVEARYRGRKELWSDFPTTFANATAGRIADLVEAMRAGRQPEVSGEEGRRALEVSLASLESISSGTEVVIRRA